MKKHWKEWVGIAACIAIVSVVLVGFFKNSKLLKEKAPSDTSVDFVGSLSEDDFVVLEIVPDESYAQLGYLQEGLEPVDIIKACQDGKAEDIAKVAGNSVSVAKRINQSTYQHLMKVYGEEKVKNNWEQVASGSAASANVYELTSGNSFVINKNKLEETFSFALGMDQNLAVKTVTAKELKEADSPSVKALLKITDFVYVLDSYVDENAQKVLSNVSDTGKTFVDSDLDWEAVDVIFERVADQKNPLPIMIDKKVYENALGKSNKTVSTKQYELNRSVKYEKASGGTNDNSATASPEATSNVKTWKTNGDLFKKTTWTAGSNKNASNNNMYKLYLMTMFRDPAEFYNLFVESKLIKDGSYDLQDSDAATYWNTYTFLPCKKEIRTSDHEEGNEEFWKTEMAITLLPKDGKWVNCNVMSFQNAVSNLVDSKSEIKTIMQYQSRSCMEGRTYEVLELEPANHFSLSAAEIEQMLPYTSYSDGTSFKLEITKMTTAEFIGKIDDLASNYDLIYIGKDIGGLHTTTDSNGKTITDYGETNGDMNGVIYAHVGAKVPFNYSSAKDTSESNWTDYNDGGNSNGAAFFDKGDKGSLRYSGNDITNLKKTQLKTFLNTGLPIVVADGLIADVKKVKPDYFNDLTYNNMYNFLKENENNLLSVDFNYRAVSSEEAEKQLNRLTKRKPTLTIDSLTAGTTTYKDLSKCNVYEFEKASENRKFTFNFNVDNPEDSNADFRFELYIDKNADGRFIKSELVGAKKFKANGSDVTYTFSMNPRYTGAFTWKVAVYPINNTGMVCSQIGYSTIRFSDDVNQRKVHVLQVQAVKGNDKHATDWGRSKAQQIDLSNKAFIDLLDDAAVSTDYDIKIKVIDMEAFTYGDSSHRNSGDSNKRGGGGWTDSNFANVVLNRGNMAEYYDMIIFGFADSYRDAEFNNDGIAADIQAYIDAGKSVLFSHDLTSQINNVDITGDGSQLRGVAAGMETTNGRGFNHWLRDAMGLDRYEQGRRAPIWDGNGDKQEGKKSTAQCKAYTKTDLKEKYGFTYTSLMQYSNFRKNEYFSDGNYHKDGWFGPYNNLYINLLSSGGAGRLHWPYIGIENDGESTPENGDAYVTSRVTLVNDGQITKYPFDLSKCKEDTKVEGGKTIYPNYDKETDTYKIAKTHGQTYQLNMESEDVVCWFALSDKQNNKGESGWYSSSPNDVANNYYIYNKGNVTYTGVGHSTLSEMSDFEKKLFVNTIIAALRAGIEGPQPVITNGYSVSDGNEERSVIYADVDADSEAEEFAKAENVEFYATDESTKSDYVYVTLEVEEEKENAKAYNELKLSGGKMVDSEGHEYKIVDSSGNEVTPMTIAVDGETGITHAVWKIKKTDLVSATGEITYMIKYPRAVLKNESSQNFKVVAYSYEGEGMSKIKGYQYGNLMRLSLFKLD